MPAFDAVDAPERALIDACIHCGFCLPACPTYALRGDESDSPRGRIYLMKAALDDRAEMTDRFAGHFDTCLGCMACVTACPSGVQYGPLIEHTRTQIERRHPRPRAERLLRDMLFRILPYPGRLRAALSPLAALRRPLRALAASSAGAWLPESLRAGLSILPPVSPASFASGGPERTPARGEQRLRVGMLTGCVQRVLQPHVNRATVRVLAAEGCAVVAPRDQGCCGALSRHAGRLEEARAFARRTIELFERADVDVVAVNAAGCGSSMKEYGQLLAGDPAWAERAAALGSRVRDVSELLADLEPRAPRHPVAATVAYHDACHLAHAQGIRRQPRELLAAIPGVTLLDIAEPDMCCGSAGIYNIVQPGTAAALGERKARNIAALAPDVIATGNPGCIMQIAAACEKIGSPIPVVHPIELLDVSIQGTSARG